MEQARYKMKNASKLSENEIKNQIIDILAPSLENSSKEDLLFHLVKIYSAITADIITGFPQEEEENFWNTFENMKKINFSDFHIFPYSDREKTAAAAFTGKIEPEVKKERVKILEKLKKSKIKEFREKFLDTVQKVYIEEIKAGKAYGYTENYLRVEVNSVSHKVADIVEVKIMSSAGDLLKGEVI